jgi:hypothetical protein
MFETIASAISGGAEVAGYRADQWKAAKLGTWDEANDEFFEADHREQGQMETQNRDLQTALEKLLPSAFNGDFFQVCWEGIPAGPIKPKGKKKLQADAIGPRFDNLPEAIGFARGMVEMRLALVRADVEAEDNGIFSATESQWVSVSVYKGKEGPVEWVKHVWDSRKDGQK